MKTISTTNAALLRSTLAAIALLACATARAGATDALCASVDDGMRAALQVSDAAPEAGTQAVPTPAGETVNMTRCTWRSAASKRTLMLTSTPFAAAFQMPPSCNAQYQAGQSVTTCVQTAPGALITLMLMRASEAADPADLAALRAQAQTLAARLDKPASRR